eukprot:CAMPEP_0172775322 /NCGR_PEP_ID=MMETSP1074-20121228/197740_1 /TAXON_ID=2916 /ORGANISM="Ceratium fusus, Strain PA161109" /LENGTH=35 /DNA_ID= /DNA_START= /DNA_END= /DNA_ORIENTATION=
MARLLYDLAVAEPQDHSTLQHRAAWYCLGAQQCGG